MVSMASVASVALMTDETGWHTRQLQAALRARLRRSLR